MICYRIENRAQLVDQLQPMTTKLSVGYDRDSILCKICYSELLEVVFLDCGHVVSCIQCTMTQDTCPICRVSIRSIARICIPITNIKTDQSDRFVSLEQQCVDNIKMCSICRCKELSIIFLPCRHTYSCENCIHKLIDSGCVICSQFIRAFIKIYFS